MQSTHSTWLAIKFSPSVVFAFDFNLTASVNDLALSGGYPIVIKGGEPYAFRQPHNLRHNNNGSSYLADAMRWAVLIYIIGSLLRVRITAGQPRRAVCLNKKA